ncbi:MAG: hypothetical protein ACPGJV_06760 [Bacteriovoracaceae bacterium]
MNKLKWFIGLGSILVVIIFSKAPELGRCPASLSCLLHLNENLRLKSDSIIEDGAELPLVFDSKSNRTLILKVYREDRGEYISETIQAFYRKGNLASEQSKKNYSAYRAMIEEYMDFALENYKRRNWSESFFEKLKAYAYEYADKTTWVGLREKQSSKLQASLAIKYAPYAVDTDFSKSVPQRVSNVGQVAKEFLGAKDNSDKEILLQLEDLFNIRLPREAFTVSPDFYGELGFAGLSGVRLSGEGIIYEITNFAIERSVKDKEYFELLLILFSRLKTSLEKSPFQSQVNQNGRRIYTYGDKLSFRAYSKWFGFQKVYNEPFFIEDTTDPTLSAKEWFILEANVDTALTNILDLIKLSKDLSESEKKIMRMEFETLIK